MGILRVSECTHTCCGLVCNSVTAVTACFQVLVKHAGRSFRLLALAVGTLKGVSAAELAEMDLQQMEARCGALDLLGLQVLSNNLRPGSKETITNLQDK